MEVNRISFSVEFMSLRSAVSSASCPALSEVMIISRTNSGFRMSSAASIN